MDTQTSTSIVNMLKKAMNDQKVVSVFARRESTDRFFGGYVLNLDEHYLSMAHISPNGLYDGYVILPIEMIWKVEIGGEYNDTLGVLYRLKKQQHFLLGRTEGKSVIEQVLAFAQKKQLVVTISITEELDDDAVGFVREFNLEQVAMLMVDQYGRKNGECNVVIDPIYLLTCDGADEAASKIMFDYRYAAESC